MSDETGRIDRKLNTKETLEKTGIKSANTLRSYWKAKKFPQPTRVTIGLNGKLFWLESEIDEWLDSRRGVTDERAA